MKKLLKTGLTVTVLSLTLALSACNDSESDIRAPGPMETSIPNDDSADTGKTPEEAAKESQELLDDTVGQL